MASEYRGPRRRSIVEGSIEGVAAGARVVEDAVDTLADSVRRRSRTSYATGASSREREARKAERRGRSKDKGRSPRGPREPGSESVVGEIADLTADLLDRLGDAAQDIADSIGERDWFPPDCPTIEPHGLPGGAAKVRFRFTNTSPSGLGKVGFEATDLLGATDRINAGAVHFSFGDDEVIPRIGPGKSRMVTLEIEIPQDARADIYRGVIAARTGGLAGREAAEAGPEGAWALVELEVEATDPGRAITQVEEPEAS
jgi:hypothetical protein